MLKKRVIISLTFLDGILYRTKKFKPDYRYTKNFLDLWSIDELIINDISKKKFSYQFLELVNFFSQNCFVPISVGGGIRKLDDADIFFKNGADKIVLGSNLNSYDTIKDISMKYGKQSIIQSLDLKKNPDKNLSYSLYSDSGTKVIKIDPFVFGKKVLEIGAGEILINNIDNDGSLLGYDIELMKLASQQFDCPIIALGGAGNWDHFSELFIKTNISAACTQNIFHFTEQSILSLKKHLKNFNISIRN